MKTTNLKQLITLLILITQTFFSQGCFNELDSANNKPVIDNYFTSDDFTGADSAVNIITGIKISWTQVGNNKDCAGYRIYRYNFSTPQLLSTVDADSSEYVDGSAISGVGYRYMVRAVDPDNNEDENTKVVSGIAWKGLTSVTALTNDSLTVYFDSLLQGYKIKISLQGENREKTEIVQLSTFSQLELGYYTINEWPDHSKIKPGATYNVYAEIIEATTGKNDGNTRALTVATKSYGYDASNAYPAGWNNIATARAFGRSPGTEPVPATPVASQGAIVPNQAQVDIGFLPFTLPAGVPTNLYRYNILRFGENVLIDTSKTYSVCAAAPSASAADLAALLNPCDVPKQPGSSLTDFHPVNDLQNGYFSVRDNTVWHSGASGKPPRYRYLMVLKHLDTTSDSSANLIGYREYLPTDKIKPFSVSIPIPPDEMVLVSREAANYEFCRIQKGIIPDPLNHNRCTYTEIGSVPYNSGPGNSALVLDSNYYDAGYNLFVDRYPLACNSNRSNTLDSRTGFTVNGLVEHKPAVAATVPNTNKDVMFSIYRSLGGGNTPPDTTGTLTACSYYDDASSTWLNPTEFDTNLGILADEAFRTTLSNKPSTGTARGRAKFSYANWDSRTAMLACNSFSETGYGEKRIPRMREYRTLTAPPFSKRIAGSMMTDLHYTRITSATAVNNPSLAWYSGGCVIGNILPQVSASFSSTMPTSSGNMTSPSIGMFDTTNVEKIASYQTGAVAHFADFFIGSKHTADCMSKYGVANILESSGLSSQITSTNFSSAWYPVSDVFNWDTSLVTPVVNFGTATASGTLFGRVSPLDNGNLDLAINFDGTNTGFKINGEYVYTSRRVTLSSPSTNATLDTKFNAALGLPVPSSVGLYDNSDLPSYTQNYAQNRMTLTPSSTVGLLYGRVTARYSTAFHINDAKNTRVRCVLPAE